jgi:glycosyltransferase involved in cell wall biosynthesis
LILKNYAQQTSRQLAKLDGIEVVCSGINPGMHSISYLECKQPIVLWTDATYAAAIDFYPHYFRNRISAESIAELLANEESALRRCRLAIFWSDWAARGAIEHYNLDPSRVKVVPVGANVQSGRNLAEIREMIESRPQDRCKLLFLGVDWFRKGGDIAVQVACELNKAGLPTELSIVGCEPISSEPLPSFVHPLGYISNTAEDGEERLEKLFSESHFLILPTRADTFGFVFCEASSYGVPSLATNVGGIPTAIRNNANGRTFDKDSEAKVYCEYITELFSNYSSYKQLSLSSFYEYESRLNWDVAGKAVKDLLLEVRP